MDWLKAKLSNLNIDFVGKRHFFAVVSIVLVLGSWVAFFVPGPMWGIDFTGGTELHLSFADAEQEVGISDLREVLESMELSEDAVQRYGTEADKEFLIRVQDPTVGSKDLQDAVTGSLEAEYGADWIKDVRVDTETGVGARLVIAYEGDLKDLDSLRRVVQARVEGANVSESKERNEFLVTLPGLGQQIQERIAEQLTEDFVVKASDAVGPKVGGDLRRQGFISIAITLGLVLVYVAFRFDIAFAPGAVLALLHDVSITVGVFILLGLEINLSIIGALLTIVGYSLNDTIVIYDRVRENQERFSRKSMVDLINVSVNETMTRTLATSVTTLLAILAFLLLPLTGMSGGGPIWAFAFAMMLGILFGTYSTIYVASPTILVMQDLRPHLLNLVALPALTGGDASGDEPGAGDADDDGAPLTRSEQRRRERARKAQEGS